LVFDFRSGIYLFSFTISEHIVHRQQGVFYIIYNIYDVKYSRYIDFNMMDPVGIFWTNVTQRVIIY